MRSQPGAAVLPRCSTPARGGPGRATALALALLAQACGITAPPVLTPDEAAPWPTAPQPRRTPLPLPEPTAAPPTATPPPTRGPADFVGRQRTRVLRVWDGQSVLVENGRTVRYLGLEAPSGGLRGEPVQPYGREAAQRNVELVEGKEVELEQDVTDVDADGQLPRYVYVDGQFVNRELLLAGLATAAPRPPDVRYQEQLAEAERQAREARRGLWSRAPTPTRAPLSRALPPHPPPAAGAGPIPIPRFGESPAASRPAEESGDAGGACRPRPPPASQPAARCRRAGGGTGG